jgi:tetratricopeptide (TPR) repeat protein
MSEPTHIIEQWLSYAAKLAAHGHLKKAVDDLLSVVESEPLNIPVRDAIIAYAAQQNDYTMVIDQHMDCAEIGLMAGDRKSAEKRYEIILALNESLPLGPNAPSELRQLLANVRPEIHLRIGEMRLDEGLIDQAFIHLFKAQEYEPGVWETHLALGRCHMAKLQYRQAIGEFQEVLRLAEAGPAHAQAYEWLGEVFFRQGRPPRETIVWWERAASLYEQQQQFAEAFGVYERILRVEPTHQKAHLALAELQAKLHDRPVDPAPKSTVAPVSEAPPSSVIDFGTSSDPIIVRSTTDF